ncbi:MAG: ATP-dependent protease ATPase subunit HslU [Bdellovibrionales bacterium]|nr:ATP-dependent protease ATPase subunit HslU [Bdellovibrionales bacterium]
MTNDSRPASQDDSGEGAKTKLRELTPPQIVERLDQYIVAQEQAKKAVAVALRNRWRRLQVDESFRDEITPKNILMIGPTGVGKTELSRRLAKLARAPFVKVEASKFTEVGYVGRDVESIIRDLVEVSVALVKEEEQEFVQERARREAEEQILDLLLPGSRESSSSDELEREPGLFESEVKESNSTRERLRKLLAEGKFEEREIEVELTKQVSTQMQVLGPQGFAEIEGQIKDLFSNMVPPQKEKRRMKVCDARSVLTDQVVETLIDHEKVTELALRRAEQSGIVFIDEIDKVCGKESGGKGPDVSREGVQRDLLPLVEGSTVATKYGSISTDHVLFIASGAFHISKPSDLMPEFQGRFPIRVELESLSAEHFFRILSEPRNALTRQYQELLAAEGVTLLFDDAALREIAKLTEEVNRTAENIGARRLHTILEKVLEELSFTAHEKQGETVTITVDVVRDRLSDIVQDSDLSKYIL